MRYATVLACALAAGWGCSESGSATIARWDPGGAASGDVDAVPFPSDLFRDADGRISLGPLPPAWGDPARLESLRRSVELRDGFCTTCTVRFPIDGELDADGLQRRLEGRPDDPIVLVDADASSPERGRAFALSVHWDENRGCVVARPDGALRAGTRYAAALTNRLLDGAGAPLLASPAFRRAEEAVEPALAELERAGVPRASVVVATTFTTGDPVAELIRVRESIHAAPPPTVRVDRVVRAGAELDALLGLPAEDRPGVDVPAAAGTGGTRAIAHATTSLVVTGAFDARRFVTGTGSDVGTVRRDADGAPVAGPRQDVPFVLIIPASADVARLPLAVALHGFNSSRGLGFVLADTAGRAGTAVLAIDAFQHGDRAASAVDEENGFRQTGGPDGFAEASFFDVTARVLGLSGVSAGSELDPGYAHGAFVQFAADAMSAIRLAVAGDPAPLSAAAPELAGLAFDEERVFVLGNSLGAVIASAVLAVESDARAYVLNVMPGSIVDNLVDSPEFRPLSETLLLPMLGVPGPYDEPRRGVDVDPVVDFFRWALEPVDPRGLARRVQLDPIAPGARPAVLVQLAALDEVASPVASEAWVATAGVEATRFEGAGHGMLEVRDQVSRYEPPVRPPFSLRPEPVTLTNPLREVHDQIEQLLAAPE